MVHAHAFPAARAHQPVGPPGFDLFGQSEACGLSDVHFRADSATGLRAIIAIHSTRLVPSVGGCGPIPYDSFASAVPDAITRCRGSQRPG